MGNVSSSDDDDSSSTSAQYGSTGGNLPSIPKGAPGTTNTTVGDELSQPGDQRVSLQKQKKRTAAAVQDSSSLGEDRPEKKAQNKQNEGSHYATTRATLRTDDSSIGNSGNNNNGHGVIAGAVQSRASEPKEAQPQPAAQVPLRGIGPPRGGTNLNDVLSGRGVSDTTGNKRFREIVAQSLEEYRSKKTKNSERARIMPRGAINLNDV